MPTSNNDTSSSFTATRVNRTTFVICESDAYNERPLIYAKNHPSLPVIILSDTGCDSPSKEHKNDRYIHLREFLESCPVQANNDQPLNQGGKLEYIIICTHCHYDHIGGIAQFVSSDTTSVVASAAGRDFITSDLDHHSLFDRLGVAAPKYSVTKWAQAFERLSWPLKPNDAEQHSLARKHDLGITIIPTPGHTPDSLVWYDHDEMHLYVGDSLYRDILAAIIWPGIGGNMIEWSFSMEKVRQFVRSENARAASQSASEEDVDGWVSVSRRVLISCGHSTTSVDGEEIMADVERFWTAVLREEIPVVNTHLAYGEMMDTWWAPGNTLVFQAPRRLMQDARDFFGMKPSLQNIET